MLLGIILWIIISVLLLTTFGTLASKNKQKLSNDSDKSKQEEIINLQKQCQRLREELDNQSKQLKNDFRSEVFEQLQPLLTNYPSALQMLTIKPDLPAKNLISLFTSLENLLENWQYETIGKPWEKVNYDPQIHQADSDDIEVGESVYIRFVGYRDGDNILSPAKVSLNLPPNSQG